MTIVTTKNKAMLICFYFEIKVWVTYLIIWKYNIYTSYSAEYISHNHWAMKYKLLKPTLILRSNIVSY